MKIRINNIKIRNYRGVKAWSASFHSGLNIVSGRNETGKSSILNAITYILTDKVISGKTSNASFKGSDGYGIEASFTIDDKLVEFIRTSKKYYIDGVSYANYKAFRNSFMVRFHIDPIDLYNAINPVKLEQGLLKADAKNKETRDSLITSINAKTRIIDEHEYKIDNDRIESLSIDGRNIKSLIKEKKNYLASFNESNSLSNQAEINQITNKVGENEKRRNELNAMKETWDKINHLRRKKGVLKTTILNLEQKIESAQGDDSDNAVAIQPAALVTFSFIEWLLVILSFGLYYFLKKNNSHTVITSEEIKQDASKDAELQEDLSRANKDLENIDREILLIKEPQTTEMVIEEEQYAMSQRMTNDVIEKNRNEQLLRTSKALHGDLEKLEEKEKVILNNLYDLKSKKAANDMKQQEAISKLFDDDILVSLFDKKSKPILKIKHRGIDFAELNNAKIKELAVKMSDKISDGQKIDSFKLIDNFELFSSNPFEGQVIAARVSKTDLELNES